MMSTLIVRYAAPLAAFGHTSRFDTRSTAATPTLSGVQGLVAAAAGISRTDAWPDWLSELHLAIRVDHPGHRITDYHTVNQPPARAYRWLDGQRKVAPGKLKTGKVGAQHISYSGDRGRVTVLANADGDRATFNTFVSRREYITDATFLIAIHDPNGTVEAALHAPVWAMYAGRKSCPLTEPFLLGRYDGSAESAITIVPTVPHPTETATDRDLERDAVLFTEPTTSTTSVEDRNDRASGFKRYRSQRRWYTSVTVPAVPDWFDVAERLAGARG